MSGKIIQKMIGSIALCALLAGCLTGCDAGKKDAGEGPNGSGTGGLVSESSPAETQAPKTLRRETVTTRYENGGVNVAVFDYSESGLAVHFGSTYGGDVEAYDISYDYDAQGAPSQMRMDYDAGTEAVIEITNSYENGKIVSVEISDILLNGESALDAELTSDSFSFYSFLSTLLRFLQHYEGYSDAAISIRNSETGVRLQNGEVVYLCSDMGAAKTVTELTQNSNGHKTQLITTVASGSENEIPASVTEVDEFGRVVEIGAVMGRKSMMMQVAYRTQAGPNARQRTEVGYVADFQKDSDMGYSDDQLEAMASQASFTYTFADDVLVFSEIIMDTQKSTCEYSVDGLLLRQTVETDSGEFAYSVVTEYKYHQEVFPWS